MRIGLLVMVLGVTTILDAQTTYKPKFEVVSIKPCEDGATSTPTGGTRGAAGGGGPRPSPGYVNWTCVTLADLIDTAWGRTYGLGFKGNELKNTVSLSRREVPKRVRGGPSWVEHDKFTIEVKVSGGPAQAQNAENRADWTAFMREVLGAPLRELLADRFQLKLRKATEDVPMYALSVAKGGLKIKQTAPQECWQRPLNLGRGETATPPPGFEGTPECGINVHGMVDRGVRQWEITHGSLHDFAEWLSGQMDRYVLDQTGVPGRFTFKFEHQPDDTTPGSQPAPDRDPGFIRINGVRKAEPTPPPNRTDGVTIFKALETLGLRLEPTKGPAEYLQIESAQKPRPDEPSPAVGQSAKAG